MCTTKIRACNTRWVLFFFFFFVGEIEGRRSRCSVEIAFAAVSFRNARGQNECSWIIETYCESCVAFASLQKTVVNQLPRNVKSTNKKWKCFPRFSPAALASHAVVFKGIVFHLFPQVRLHGFALGCDWLRGIIHYVCRNVFRKW